MPPILLIILLAAFISSVYSIATKFAVADGSVRPLPAAFFVQIIAGIIAAAFLLVNNIIPQPAAMPYVFGVVAFALTGFVLTTTAFAREDASVVAPVLGLKVIFLAFLESLFRQHEIGIEVVLAAVVSVIGLAFISQTDRWSLHPRDLLRPGVLIMALGALTFSISDLFLKGAVDRWSALSVTAYALTIQALISLTLLLALVRLRVPAVGGLRLDQWGLLRRVRWPLLIGGVTAFAYQYFFFLAFARGENLTQINILYNSRNLMVVLLMALLVLGGKSTVERVGWRAYTYRTIGALLTIAAVALALIPDR